MIYFDNNATTRVDDSVVATMSEVLAAHYGNPSSAHQAGSCAMEIVDEARHSVASLLRAVSDNEIVFTSSGTEANNWAIFGASEAVGDKSRIVTTTVEHESVSKPIEALESKGWHVTRVGVDRRGRLDLGQLRASLTVDTALVSVRYANNETGVIFPIREIADIVKERSEAKLHVDAVNATGKIAVNAEQDGVDLLSLSAHKFHGPKGIGALYIRDGVQLPPRLLGGSQERGRRAGTAAVHQIAGLGTAARIAQSCLAHESVGDLRDRLESNILQAIPETTVNGDADAGKRLPNTSNISFEGLNGEMIMSLLDDRGICVSTGSACHSQDNSPSSVLQAMDVPYQQAMGSIRFSLGRFNTADEVDRVLEVLGEVIPKLKRLAGR